MKRIVDKVILFLLCVILMMQMTDFVRPVIVLFLALIMTELGLYIEKPKWMGCLFSLALVCCCFIPEFTYFLPLMLYNICWHEFWWGFASVFLVFRDLSIYEPWGIAIWVIACILAVFLAISTTRSVRLQYQLNQLRDTSTELQNVMRERNQELMEKQDYEIHLATLRERNRIAREIHDNVGHMLSRSILQVGALYTIYKDEPLHGQLASVNETLNLAMNSIRESVHDLHDDSIDLRQAILEATKEMKEKYTLHFEYDISPSVPRKVKYCFITTVKEAMSNIVKHSNADTITIILREHPGFYQMSIEDNGTPVNSTKDAGIGLTNMKERVEALHGVLRIQKENGFKIFISITKMEGMTCE